MSLANFFEFIHKSGGNLSDFQIQLIIISNDMEIKFSFILVIIMIDAMFLMAIGINSVWLK
jgi:hypothetical protein